MEAGIVTSLKLMLRQKQVSYALHIMDTRRNRAYKVDLYPVFNTLSDIWNKFLHT